MEWNLSSTPSVPVPSQTPVPTGTTNQTTHMAKPVAPTSTSQNTEQTEHTAVDHDNDTIIQVSSSIGPQPYAVIQNIADLEIEKKRMGPNLLILVAVPVLVVVGCILIVSGIIVGLSALICEKGKRYVTRSRQVLDFLYGTLTLLLY